MKTIKRKLTVEIIGRGETEVDAALQAHFLSEAIEGNYHRWRADNKAEVQAYVRRTEWREEEEFDVEW